ncbi:MAG: hypothetical protein IPQ00_02825 [Chloracidobacterium sp.]|nr:hypothetical protein [Chloracidobacterium sp.]
MLFQFCPLSCKGCWVPHLHNPDGGELVAVKTLAEKLLDPPFELDGVSILGWRTVCTTGKPVGTCQGTSSTRLPAYSLLQRLYVRGARSAGEKAAGDRRSSGRYRYAD